MSQNTISINEKIRKFIGEDLSDLITRIRETADEAAELEAEANYLKECRKVKLEELQVEHMNHLKTSGERVTDKKVESLARADSRYKMHLVKTRDTERKAKEKLNEHFELRNTYDLVIEQMRNRRLTEQKKLRGH